MKKRLVITVSLISGRFHGRNQTNQPEWPPSPFRLYQALVAGAAQTISVETARPTLQWMERCRTISILTPPAYQGKKATSYVLTNQRDKTIGTKTTEASLKSAKVVHPVILSSHENCDLHFVYSSEAPKNHLETLQHISRGVSHFGQGIDAAEVRVANLASEQIENLTGTEWISDETQGTPLPVPFEGSLEALERSYHSWRKQASQSHKKLSLPPIPVPRLATQKFRHEQCPDPPVFRCFELRDLDGSRAALPDTLNTRIAGMIRHLTTDPDFASSLGWSPQEMAMLHGHLESRGESPRVATQRFGFIGLPTLRWLGDARGWSVDNCRRVFLTAPAQYADLLDEFTLKINHRELRPLGDSLSLTLVLSKPDSTTNYYTQSSSRWSTVTPMVLPNHLASSKDRRRLRNPKLNDETRSNILAKLDRRIDTMIRNAITNAGISRTLANAALIKWNSHGFWPGASSAKHHTTTKHFEKHPKRHILIEWRDPLGAPLQLSGPLTIGAGSHAGLGLFAPMPSELNHQQTQPSSPTP